MVTSLSSNLKKASYTELTSLLRTSCMDMVPFDLPDQEGSQQAGGWALTSFGSRHKKYSFSGGNE